MINRVKKKNEINICLPGRSGLIVQVPSVKRKEKLKKKQMKKKNNNFLKKKFVKEKTEEKN